MMDLSEIIDRLFALVVRCANTPMTRSDREEFIKLKLQYDTYYREFVENDPAEFDEWEEALYEEA